MQSGIVSNEEDSEKTDAGGNSQGASTRWRPKNKSDLEPINGAVNDLARKGLLSSIVFKDSRSSSRSSISCNGGNEEREVPRHSWQLQDASHDVKNNKEIVLNIVAKDWRALQHASLHLKADKEVVLAAVRHEGKAILWASEILKADRDVILATVNQDGNCLRFASSALRSDKEIVLAAVKNKPESLKFALAGLNQDRECLVAAGLWDENYADGRSSFQNISSDTLTKEGNIETTPLSQQPAIARRKVVLSTRFSLDEDSTPTATRFTVLLKKNSFFLSGEEENPSNGDTLTTIYSPNAFNKGTCDPEWTRLEWPCIGTFETCKKVSHLKTGVPNQSQCCWRYSFRWHLQTAKETNGFMIQIVELRQIGDESGYNYEHRLGKGQKIERIMARDVGTKVFVVYQPLNVKYRYREFFHATHISHLVDKINEWYSGRCHDMTVCHVDAPANYEEI